ncbi:MAG: hypothetical protein GX660_08120 [Clostridiaceae bacterium]|nr:hypothetical protein [Clostridiaceae bacterium]
METKFADTDTLPVNAHDICNYAAKYGFASYQIQTIMKLEGRLNYNTLVRSVMLSVEQEPVFICRFVENDPPFWKRIDNINEDMLCSYEETENTNYSIRLFLQSPMELDKDPGLKIRLIRSKEYDTLCLKINHMCTDGAGVKEYIQLLSSIYSTLEKNHEVFIPIQRVAGRKDQDILFRELGINNPETLLDPEKITPKTMWVFPLWHGGTNVTRYAVKRLPYGQLDILSRYGKERGATINDLILTAYYRAMFEISNPPYNVPMDISTTVDLRRYLPGHKTEAIRNFSAGFITRIPRIKSEAFGGTLSRVKLEVEKIKKEYPGLHNAMGGEWIEKMNFFHINAYFRDSYKINEFLSMSFPVLFGNLCLPGLSNLGYISKALIKFGETTVTDAYVLPPAVRAPGFLLLVSSYNGVMTLSTGYYKNAIRRKDVERVLNGVEKELTALGRS